MDEEAQVLVVDIGSSTTKAGWSGDDEPRTIFPSVVAHPKFKNQMVDAEKKTKDVYVGNEIEGNGGAIPLVSKRPVENGIVKDWNGIEKIWEHIFYNELRVEKKQVYC